MSADLGAELERANETSPWKVGDSVKIAKEGSQKGLEGSVVDPDWTGRVKVKMDESGAIKSYLPAELLHTRHHDVHTSSRSDLRHSALSWASTTRAAKVDLNDLHCLIDDEEAFLSDVAKRLSSLQQLVMARTQHVGLDKDTRKFTPDAEDGLRKAFKCLDTDGSGTLSWQEILTGVKRAATKEDQIDMIALSNTVGMMAATDERNGVEEVDEDSFVALLQKKARCEIGPSMSVLHLIQRYVQRIDTVRMKNGMKADINNIHNMSSHNTYSHNAYSLLATVYGAERSRS
jgi:Ca2+-binding EF-hand superfamily protein